MRVFLNCLFEIILDLFGFVWKRITIRSEISGEHSDLSASDSTNCGLQSNAVRYDCLPSVTCGRDIVKSGKRLLAATLPEEGELS